MWYSWVFILNPFFLLWSIFFSRKLCFLCVPCLLLITDSISLDNSGKPTVGFFFKITSPSWIDCKSHLMNLFQLIDCWRTDDEFSWNNFYFIAVKRTLIWQKILKVSWRIYLNIIFWILLTMLTSLMIWKLNITVSSTLKYCCK